MNDKELKKIAQEILIGTAQGNWDYGLDIENEELNLDDNDYDKIVDLLNSAKSSVSWDWMTGDSCINLENTPEFS